MNARVRKFIGGVGIVLFLAFYAWAVVMIGERLPAHWAAQIGFYAVAGLAWGVPILPLITWMNRGRQ